MLKYSIIFISTFLLAKSNFDDSFITQYEYGKLLYENPRGISCTKCHGKDARGKIIATFTHKRNKKEYICTIRTKDITNISYDNFIQKLDPKLEKPKKIFDKTQICDKLTYGNSMPTYFLTQEELKSIHFYLKNRENYE